MDSWPSQSGRIIDNNNLIRTSSNRSDNNNQQQPDSPARSSSSTYNGSGSQSLASILNNPHVGKSGVYGSDASWITGWWSSSSSSSSTGPTELPPLTIKQNVPDVLRSEFEPYLSSISESYGRFEDIRNHSSKEEVITDELLEANSNLVGQGEALVACLREVPSLYFKEDFALEEGATFRAACPFSTPLENITLQEKLSHYLDTVELHLVKEISLRSNSFFEAQGQLQDLNVEVFEACGRIRDLKETIRLLDADLVDSARGIQDLNLTRSNLISLQQKLRLILYVNQALSALKLLVAAADCAGALDVTDDLQNLL
ncbi:Vacuolar protein sorting-associated protein 54 protein, partial [Thalictrum thalictroides]